MTAGDPNKKQVLTLEQLRAALQDHTESDDQLPEEFLTDASEGLAGMEDDEQLSTVLKQLNHQMRKQLGHKKNIKSHRKIWDLTWTYWAIVIVLILTITAFWVVRLYLKKS
jgi:hypothetical protein